MALNDRTVYIIAADPLARGGLAAVLAGASDWQILGEGTPQAIAAQLSQEVAQPDVFLWDLGWSPQTQIDTLAAFLQDFDAPPTVVLVDSPEGAPTLWTLNIAAALRRSATVDQLTAALSAAVAGLRVFSPDLLPPAIVDNPDFPPLVDPLTPREMDVLELLAQGLPNKSIARGLGISEHTVKFHMNSILGKLNAQSRTEAVVNAGRAGIIQV